MKGAVRRAIGPAPERNERCPSFPRLAAAALAAIACALPAPAAHDPEHALPARANAAPPAAAEIMSLGLRGVHFIPNHGQWSDDEVFYGFKSQGLDIAFRESSLTMHLRRETSETSGKRQRPTDQSTAPAASGKRQRPPLPGAPDALADASRSHRESLEYEHLVLEVTFPGSNVVLPRAAKPQAARFNYFIGDDESRWASDVPSYGMIVYENIYDGIDLHVMGAPDSRGVLKYEFHCQPGADHTQIRIRYDGIDALCLAERTGDLLIETPFGTLRDTAPIVWQENINPLPRLCGGGQGKGSSDLLDAPASAAAPVSSHPHPNPPPQSRGREPERSLTLPARFETLDRHTYTIALDATPDPSLPLVIDPEIEWMYYLGGSDSDIGYGIAVDSAGNALVTGFTWSRDFTGRNNSFHGSLFDAFALKVSPSGRLEWMTYLGGSNDDQGHGIAVDNAGNVLVTGYTRSGNFAGRNNLYPGGLRSAYALKISPSGELQWMTYLGGGREDRGYGIAVDGAGNALVTGSTDSTDFYGRNNTNYGGSYDAFALKISPSGELQWMTYLGGRGAEGGNGITVDGVGNALVTGSTSSIDFFGRNNTNHGDRDAFALKVSPSGQLQWMTYLGGSSSDRGYGIAVDSAGNALVTGRTSSTDFTGRNNSYYGGGDDAFALKISPSGQLQWMTYLGGSGREWGYGIAVDGAGHALVTGFTGSTDFAGRNNSHHGGSEDAFALKISPSGHLQWMTYLGGSGSDWGYGIAADSAGNVLVAGDTRSTDFYGRNNSFYGGISDAFIVKLRIDPRLSVDATCPEGGPIRILWERATPNGRVALLFARETGSVTIPHGHACAGTTLGLGRHQIHVAVRPWSDANGSGYVSGIAGAPACDGHFQLLDLETCGTSNVVRVE